MKPTRRDILKLGLGAAQVGLLTSFGLPSRRLWASENPPTKLLTIYVAGGWMPSYFFCPLDDAQVQSFIPAPSNAQGYRGEPLFYDSSHVPNLDGTGRAPDDGDPRHQRLRIVQRWDEARLSQGQADGRDGTAPHGWSWRYNNLHEDVCVVHGIDQGTAAHESGKISAMCGAAGSRYRAPAMHSVVANALYERFADTRPLGAVALGVAPVPDPLSLPAPASPIQLQSLGSLAYTLSERNDSAWAGLRGRQARPEVGYDGVVLPTMIDTNEMDEYVLRRLRRLRGTTNRGTDAFYAEMHDMVSTVSKQLSQDVVSVLEATPGWEYSDHPYWIPSNWTPFGADLGGGVQSDAGQTWNDNFQLTLKLLKSDLCSAVSLDCRGVGNWFFDSHGNGHPLQFLQVRATMDVVGRLLGEMKRTPTGMGRTLLDDTQVVIFSEFARTWPGSNKCDHWPVTSVAFAGGATRGNRQIGNYDFTNLALSANGPNGAPVDLIDEGGDAVVRPPRSADVVHTVYHMMGIEEFFVPGGSGNIVGVRG